MFENSTADKGMSPDTRFRRGLIGACILIPAGAAAVWGTIAGIPQLPALMGSTPILPAVMGTATVIGGVTGVLALAGGAAGAGVAVWNWNERQAKRTKTREHQGSDPKANQAHRQEAGEEKETGIGTLERVQPPKRVGLGERTGPPSPAARYARMADEPRRNPARTNTTGY